MSMQDLSSKTIEELVSLRGRSAIVTGGAAGLGFAICKRLAEAGADVLIADLDEQAATEAADRLADHEGTIIGAGLDASDSSSIKALADRAVNEFGAIDIWVNNAGMYPNTPLLEITDEHWDRVVNLNLRGTFIGAREAAKRMVETGTAGVIVNISSTGAFNASSGANSAHYIASKHGVAGLTKSLATELGPHGIRAVAVAPTLSETPGVQANRERGLGDVLDAYGSRLPLGRLGKPDDVARAVLFAVSGLAGFVSGSTVLADGGDLAAG